MSILSRHLVMMKSIICQCPERGCVQMVLRSSFCLNMVFVTISSNSEHRVSRSSPLEMHFPIPCLPMTKGHLSLFLPILALKSPISSSLFVWQVPFNSKLLSSISTVNCFSVNCFSVEESPGIPLHSKLIFYCRRKMRSSSAVLGNPGNGRSVMVFRAVVHFHGSCQQKC